MSKSKSTNRLNKRKSDISFSEASMNELINKKGQGKLLSEVDVSLWKNMIFYKSIANIKQHSEVIK